MSDNLTLQEPVFYPGIMNDCCQCGSQVIQGDSYIKDLALQEGMTGETL